MSHSQDPFRPPSQSGPAPIVWTSPDSSTQEHPWSGPDPFAQPDPPAAAPPVTESQVQPAPLMVELAKPVVDEPAVEQFAPPVQRVEPPVQERGQAQDQWQGRSPEPAAPQQPSEDVAEDDDALSIGRGRGNSIVLDDMLVSRHHVRITADDDGLVLQDLGSRNGTYVNDERVQRTSLHEGDRIGIGATTFEVRDGWLVSI